MRRVVVRANKVVTRGGQCLHDTSVIIENGIITSILPTITSSSGAEGGEEGKQQVEYVAALVCAGFIDIHNHGIGGSESVLEYWLSDHTIETLPRYATTSLLASVTFPYEDETTRDSLTHRVVTAIEQRIAQPKPGCTRILGIHAEGPIIQTCGGLPASNRDMSVNQFKSLLDSMPSLKIMTISPSLEKGIEYGRLRSLLDRRIRPALGHDAIADEASILGAQRVAAEYGLRLHTTHLFNASVLHHRNVSLCNFGLLKRYPNGLVGYQGIEPPTVEIIADFVHLHPLTVQLVIDAKGPENTAIISDVIMENTAYGCSRRYAHCEIEIQPHPSQSFRSTSAPSSPSSSASTSSTSTTTSSSSITQQGQQQRFKVVQKGTGTIAGSCANLLQMFHDLVQVLDVPLEAAVMMLSETPARIAQVDGSVGTVEVGKKADLLLFDEQLNLLTTLIDGSPAWQQRHQ
jgi:N-acetylglucosamine-6-phosphate deacetylase